MFYMPTAHLLPAPLHSATAPEMPPRPPRTLYYNGALTVEATLTGNYVYYDAENDVQGASTFHWYTGTDSTCAGKTPINGVTSQTYTTQTGDAGKFICFGVTPVAVSGTSPGAEVIWAPDVAIGADAMPTVSEVSISGTMSVGQTLTGMYLYNDAEGHPQGTSIFRWYTGTDAVCTGKILIDGATAKTYVLTAAEQGKFVCFGVTPVATAGTSPGAEVIAASLSAVDTQLYTSSPVPGTLLEMTTAKPADTTKTLMVSNTGTGTLSITGITFGGTDAAKFSVSPNTFPVSITAGGNRVFTITGNGSAAGIFTASMAVAHNAAGSPAKYTLSSVISDCYVPSYDTYAPPANQAPVADKLSVCTDGSNPVSVTLTGSDADAPNWFLLLLKPLTYSVVTQPKNGTLTGTAPNLIYTPNAGFTGTDSFTYRAYDGTAYSEPATASVATTAGGCFCVSDSFDMNISCAEFQGVRYGFTLNHLKPADDPSGLYWKLNTAALRNASQSAGNCISIGNDFKLNIPCARFQGTEYGFTMDYSKPAGSDPFGLYWKMDLGTLKTR